MPVSDGTIELDRAVSAGDISVVICAYTLDRQQDLVAAIESVLNQEVAVRELIVVIDYNDELLAWVQHRYPILTVVPNSGSRGLSGARNTGAAHSSGSVVAFLDDDAQASSNWA